MSHTVNECPGSKLRGGGRQRLHSVDDVAVTRLQGTATITHTHPFNGPFSRTTHVSQYQKGKNQSGIY